MSNVQIGTFADCFPPSVPAFVAQDTIPLDASALPSKEVVLECYRGNYEHVGKEVRLTLPEVMTLASSTESGGEAYKSWPSDACKTKADDVESSST